VTLAAAAALAGTRPREESAMRNRRLAVLAFGLAAVTAVAWAADGYGWGPSDPSVSSVLRTE
jgi:hypothetical protein